jgi:hypothetical protein
VMVPVSVGMVVTGLVPARALVAEGVGELAAQPCVFIGQDADAFECGGEAGAQGRVGGSLAWGNRIGDGSAAELLDLGADAGLGVEPGPGDPGRGGDAGERDGSVRQASVMRSHLRRIMIEDFLHHVLWDVSVDKGRSGCYLYSILKSAWWLMVPAAQ